MCLFHTSFAAHGHHTIPHVGQVAYLVRSEVVLGATTWFQFIFLPRRESHIIQDSTRVGWMNMQERHALMQFDGWNL